MPVNNSAPTSTHASTHQTQYAATMFSIRAPRHPALAGNKHKPLCFRRCGTHVSEAAFRRIGKIPAGRVSRYNCRPFILFESSALRALCANSISGPDQRCRSTNTTVLRAATSSNRCKNSPTRRWSTCPACGKDTLTKLVSAAGFQLKGSGWYQTDFRSSGAKPAAKPAGGKEAGGADSASAGTDKGGAGKDTTLGQSARPRKPSPRPRQRPAHPAAARRRRAPDGRAPAAYDHEALSHRRSAGLGAPWHHDLGAAFPGDDAGPDAAAVSGCGATRPVAGLPHSRLRRCC